MRPPRLHSPRLTLTPHVPADLTELAAMWADPEVVRHITGCVSSLAESRRRLMRYRALWRTLGFGYWAVRAVSDGRYLGDLGFADFGRNLTPSIAGIPEAGWVFNRSAWGMGYASEALQVALAWLDAAPSHTGSVCLISPQNTASLRLAGRLGYTAPVDASLAGQHTLLLTRPGRRQPTDEPPNARAAG